MNVASCGKTNEDAKPEPLKLSSSFNDGDSIPQKFSCKVPQHRFPEIRIMSSAKPTSSYALIMDDPDAVAVVGYVWNHWVLYNMSPDVRVIQEGADKTGPLPSGTFRGKTSFGDTLYGGPCPPAGQKHTYIFTLYGLDIKDLGLPRGATSAEVRAAMKGHILDSAVLKGTFENK